MSTKEEIFEYVTNSPENTNPAVLRSLLNSLDSGGGSNAPFVVTITATSESVTADKTFAEITAALEANRRILMNFVNNNSGYSFQSSDNIPLAYSHTYPGGNAGYTFVVSYVGDGEITVLTFDIYESDGVVIAEEKVTNY